MKDEEQEEKMIINLLTLNLSLVYVYLKMNGFITPIFKYLFIFSHNINNFIIPILLCFLDLFNKIL